LAYLSQKIEAKRKKPGILDKKAHSGQTSFNFMPIKHLKPIGLTKSLKAARTHWKSLASSAALAVGALALIGFFVLTLMLAWLSHDLPDPNALLSRNVPQSTKIYDRTGEVLLYEIHGDEKRTLVKIEDIPDVMQKATVAIEDKDFYNHHGIYWWGMVRAFTIGLVQRGRVQGTSTLTQQFVRNALLTTERSLPRKLKEILLSLQLERKYTKDQILQLYLNEIPYGSTMYGIESAAQGYFGKDVKELTLDEAALLAAIPQGPDLYNPYGTGSRGDNRKLLLTRQHTVLSAMADQGYITKDQAEEAKKVDVLAKLIPKNVGDIKAPHFVMWVREQLVEKYGQKVVEEGGLSVLTTLDWRLQQAAEKAVVEGVDARGERYGFTNASLVALGPKDGQVLAMVGSKDFFNDEIDGQVNVALRPRQPGSSFKPIVYTEGFVKGYLPETTLWDVNTTFKTDVKDYAPKNYDLKERGPLSIRQALQGSLNIPAVKMLYLAGVGSVLDLSEQLGYTTLGDRSRFGLSLVLGGGEVKLLEHAAAYGTFATEGVRMPSASILKVTAPDGNVLEEWKIAEGVRVLEPQITRLLSNVLSDNGARAYVFGGTNSLTLPGRPVAAKTGTTNDYHDAWTMGYTPSLVAGVWVGNADNKEMKRGADGSVIAAPIWQAFMKEAVKGSPVENFVPPQAAPSELKPVLLGKDFKTTAQVDRVTGKLATPFTPPELVENRDFYVAHDILYYVDKDDPRGPAPSNPERDPQFKSWEGAVQDWVQRTQWNTTSTIPTEYDDIHTSDNAPNVSISFPWENSDLLSRSFTVKASANSSRPIRSFTVKMDGYVLGLTGADGSNIEATIPNAIEKGQHALVVEARDDVGSVGRATVLVNVLGDASSLRINVTEPAPGSTIKMSEFPKSVKVSVSDLTNVKKVDLYMQRPNGGFQLVGTDIGPDESAIEFQWTAVQTTGNYFLYAETTDENGQVTKGDRISVEVSQ
jgi:penicillin-binding protein 1C